MKQKYFVLLFINFIWLAPVFSQTILSNGGELVIEPGTQISTGDFLNNADGDFTNNGSLFVQGDYKNDGIVNTGTGTTTFNQRDTSPSETIQNMYGTSTFEFYNLVVNNNTSLGVLVDDGIGLTVKNNLNLQEGNLRLEGVSQLIQEGVDNNTLGGTGVLLIDQQGIASGYGYNYWSSPVTVNGGNSATYSLDNVLYDGTDSSVNPFSPTPMLFTTAEDGMPSVVDGSGNVTTAASVSSQFLYTYVKHNFGAPEWDKIDETTNLDPTNGYIMKGTNTGAANQNYTFKGQPNNGTYSYPILVGESSLLGNPYPSAMNVISFIFANLGSVGLFGEIYLWTDGGTTEHYSDAVKGGYAIRNAFEGTPASIVPDGDIGDANTTPPGQYIAMGQGFFVNATGNGNINFSNDHRAYYPEDGSGSTFYKNTNQKKGIASKDDLSKNQIIRLGYEDPEGYHRQIVLGFLPDGVADMNYNIGYDSPVFGPREDDLFFIIENDPSKQYVIQGVGLFDENDVFPLSLTIAEEGVHTIMLDAVENFEGDVFIYDAVLDVTYNLKEESFSPSIGIGVYNDRFQLVFKPQKTLGVNEPNKRSFNVYFNNENSIVVNNKKSLEIAKISIFNTLGQQVLSLNKEDVQNLETRIPFSKNRGVYLVIVETNNAKETYRIIN